MKPCPLVFEPLYKPRIWGGRRLEQFGKTLPPDDAIGESWELADLEGNASIVARGPAKGRSLPELVKEWGDGLMGDARLWDDGRFPLLIKYLDAVQTLSVQVHPDEATAARVGGEVRLKNEAWYILDAEPGAVIYRGFRPGVTRADVEAAITDGGLPDLLQQIEVRPDHCYYLPSGTVHALGEGVVVAEVQTPSDTTYRLYDWDRVDAATGQPRQLHIEEALSCMDVEPCSPVEEKRSHVGSVWMTVTRLVTSPHFTVERVNMVDGMDHPIPHSHVVVWMLLSGQGTIVWGEDDGSTNGPGVGAAASANSANSLDIAHGDTIVLPAGLENARIQTKSPCKWLEITLPS